MHVCTPPSHARELPGSHSRALQRHVDQVLELEHSATDMRPSGQRHTCSAPGVHGGSAPQLASAKATTTVRNMGGA
jgi:hypothetical protein